MAQTPQSAPPVTPIPLPKGIPPKPAVADFRGPVSWLFGRELIASMKSILLYSFFPGKLDHRDWMRPAVIPSFETPEEIEKFWRRWNKNWDSKTDDESSPDNEFWFDYLADTGDGQRAVYSIGCLCLSNMYAAREPTIGDVLELEAFASAGHEFELPRGTFLFVGGDTGYHVADYNTLAKRFQNPFWWACKDLDARMEKTFKQKRLLFGIPGNHDWYDSLDGFNRQFRRPVTGENVSDESRPPLLQIPTFERRQEASYFALRLPFDWWLWGMDTEEGKIDFRQLEYFKKLKQSSGIRKLIVATPEPTTVFGRYDSPESNQAKTQKAIGLERPYLKNGEPVPAGECRLDVSGDVHHYARYFSKPAESNEASNYASVMAGGGGAFFHPSQTNLHEVEQQALYPDAKTSRDAVADQIFKFKNIWTGGWVQLGGLVIAFILFFAATIPISSRDAVDSFPLWIAVGISPPETIPRPDTPPAYVKYMPRYIWGPGSTTKGPSYYLSLAALVSSLIVFLITLGYSSSLFATKYNPAAAPSLARTPLKERLILWALVLTSFAMFAGGIYGFWMWESHLTRYSRSLIVLAAFLWAICSILESIKISGRLFREAYVTNIRSWHYWPLWALSIMAIVEVGLSLWKFGRQEAFLLISDIVQILVTFGMGIGLILFAVSTGGELKKGIGKVGFFFLGVFHALLQLSIPFLLVRKGNLFIAPLAALLFTWGFKYIGRALAKRENGWPLALAFVVYGCGLIAIPYLIHAHPLNLTEDKLTNLLLCLLAGALGAIFSCVLFAWYLAVSLAFNGHNNEAGGAARIEGFKQIIRFRINREGLTGFVVGFDKPVTDAKQLQPKIIDVFHIAPSQS